MAFPMTRHWQSLLLCTLLVVHGCAAPKSEEEQKQDDQLRMELFKGKGYLERGKDEQALTALRKASELDPNNAQVWADMGLAYGRTGQHGASLSAMARAYKLEPNKLEIQHDYGVALLRNNRLDEAEKVLRIALATAQGRLKADVLYNLSLIMEKQGQEREMVASLEECLTLRPNHVNALIKLADYHRNGHRPDREQEFLQLALMERGKDVTLLDRMVNLLIQNGHTQQAIPLMQRIVSLAPESAAGMRASRKLQLLQGNAPKGALTPEGR